MDLWLGTRCPKLDYEKYISDIIQRWWSYVYDS
jgi:hypothetical protein